MPKAPLLKPFLARTRRLTIPHNKSELFTTIGIVAAIAVLVVIAGLFIRTFFWRVEMTTLAIHTFRIIQQLEKLAIDLRSAESEALAFSLTRGPNHFEQHNGRIASVNEDLNRLRSLTGDNPSEDPYLDKVESAVADAARILDLLMSLPPAPQPSTTQLTHVETSMSETREAMRAFHRAVRRMRHEEERELNVRLEALDDTRTRMAALSAAGIVLTAGLLGWLLWMIRMETARRRLAQETLERSHAQLESRVHERTSQLTAANERLSSVSKQIIQVQEEERRSIARDLHDEIGQALTAVKINAQEMAEHAKGTDVEPLVRDSLDLLSQLVSRVRGLALELRPSLLDELGLREASKWYLNKLATRSELAVTFEADALWNRLTEDIEIACFRVLQEALTNVVKHARATTVSVKLHQTDEHLELMVCDDGVGLTANDIHTSRLNGTGLGLIGMEERLHLLGGIFHVESQVGAGTQITAKFPIRNNAVGHVALNQVAI